MISDGRHRQGVGATPRKIPPASEVTMIAKASARRTRDEVAREPQARRHLYLERASLIDITERPVIVMSRPLPGEQTQIVRRPVKKARGRRWIFIFGGAAATATLLAAWFGFSHHTAVAVRTQIAPMGERPAVVGTASVPVTAPVASSSRPIVAPVAAPAPAIAAGARSAASGRHSKKVSARLASSSRLAAHRSFAHVAPAPSPATVAWVDPFVDR